MSANTPVRTLLWMVTNHQGRVFAVRVLPVGARYGRRGELVTDEAMVEFYDTTYADDTRSLDADAGGVPGVGPLGQFVSRYYVTTILGTDGFGLGYGSLYLDGGHSGVWTIDASAMLAVRSWLRREVSGS